MDNIRIHNLTFETRVGVYDWEHTTLQIVHLDLDLFTDTQKAGQSDQLADAIDYAAVAQRVQSVLKERHFQLIEAMAETVAQRLLAEFNLNEVEVTVKKPGALVDADHVSVTIRRQSAG